MAYEKYFKLMQCFDNLAKPEDAIKVLENDGWNVDIKERNGDYILSRNVCECLYSAKEEEFTFHIFPEAEGSMSEGDTDEDEDDGYYEGCFFCEGPGSYTISNIFKYTLFGCEEGSIEKMTNYIIDTYPEIIDACLDDGSDKVIEGALKIIAPVQDEEQEIKYPDITQYTHSIQDSGSFHSLSDGIEPVMNANEPVFVSGDISVVFKMKRKGKYYALKCFLKDIPDPDGRQKQIVKYIKENPSPYFVDYHYLEKELRVDACGGQEYPVAWMEWVEADTLGQKILKYCDDNDREGLTQLAQNFKEFALWILDQPFAHGNLKPDNLLVKEDGSMVLVDYDGMFIPEFKGKTTNELGSNDYQHPGRTDHSFDRDLDDFSLLVIYITLLALAEQPDLFVKIRYRTKILFFSYDFKNMGSELWQNLRQIDALNESLELLVNSLQADTIAIPGLHDLFTEKKTEFIFKDTLRFKFSKGKRLLEVYRCFVRGLQYGKGMDLLPKMKEGETITLLREPANKYDPNAIAIYYKHTHIGYIPREDNKEFAVLLEKGIITKGIITELNKEAEAREACKVVFYAEPVNNIMQASNINEKGVNKAWWDGLSEEWKTIFKEKVLGITKESSISDNKLEKISSLTKLDLQTPTNDLSPLSSLVNLQELRLYCHSTDLSPLSGLVNLTQLDLSSDKTTDFSPLSGLVNLTQLNLRSNQITDISPLSGLVNLTQLNLSYNQITDISPLSGLVNLTQLDLWSNQITDLSPLSRLVNLTQLNLNENQITDLSPLSRLVNLTQLDLSSNPITDISPLSGMVKLTELRITHTQITDISPLSDMVELTYLLLSLNQITDIGPLSGLINLNKLLLSENQITDVSPLSGLINLTELNLRENQITDIGPLSGLINLKRLELSENKIIDVSPLSGLVSLKDDLSLKGNQITDVSPLSGLINLICLSLDSNKITDIKPLSSLENLVYLGLDEYLRADKSLDDYLLHCKIYYSSGNMSSR